MGGLTQSELDPFQLESNVRELGMHHIPKIGMIAFIPFMGCPGVGLS